jgi:hypothetical protein
MLKYLHSLVSSKKDNMTLNSLMYDLLTKEQQTKLHKKYNVIIVVGRTPARPNKTGKGF